jgi:Fe-S-cluster-containing dehydrogenase component/DMSO reductase anchor subunit
VTFSITDRGPELLPLDAGEQYRFTFSMDACIGCHSCEVACAEQNGNPPGVNWRKVGEVEGGVFPDTRRLHVSMGCNHCLEPSCLSGCPTNAYVKLANGVVQHQADECIGCQYCIWNCPYEVPVFNPERRIVTKCDMCLPRLDAGLAPACVGACPTRAISVEPVNVAAWRDDHQAGDAPGLPPVAITLSTTRIVTPARIPADTFTVSDQRLAAADPHWPLIFLTVLTQLAVGSVAGSVVAEVVTQRSSAHAFAGGAVVAFLAGALALLASMLHLGRPAHAWKAVRNLRRSWLSREVLLFSAFAATAMVYAVATTARAGSTVAGVAAVVLGAMGIYASARLYLVPARPVWRSARTVVAFFAGGLATGSLVAYLATDRSAVGLFAKGLLAVSVLGTAAQLLVYRHLIAQIARRPEREYRGTARLLFGRFRGWFLARLALAVVACGLLVAVIPVSSLSGSSTLCVYLALTATVAGEFIGRYLFFVTVTPMSAAGSFFRGAA